MPPEDIHPSTDLERRSELAGLVIIQGQNCRIRVGAAKVVRGNVVWTRDMDQAPAPTPPSPLARRRWAWRRRA